nr:retrovirus-related Pol polyprotein from transposon 17.6 [Tanacetum cinerariifolium]
RRDVWLAVEQRRDVCLVLPRQQPPRGVCLAVEQRRDVCLVLPRQQPPRGVCLAVEQPHKGEAAVEGGVCLVQLAAAAVEGGVCLVLLAAAAVEGGVCLGCRGSSNVGGVCFGAAEAGSNIGSICFGVAEAGSNTSRALIDVHKGELTLRIRNEAITYNLDQTVRYSANYNQMTANKIDVVKSACEEYSQEVLGFSNVTTSGTPTPKNDPIVYATSPTLTPFGDIDFLLFEEADAFIGLEDDPDSPKVNPFYYDLEGDILFLEAILNKDELKDLPHHLEYAFLEGDSKLPIIIAKELRSEEKAALIKVLKSHKRAIAWKLSDIQGGFTVVENKENELIPTRLVTGWRVCIEYRKLNKATQKDHFPLSFMDQMLERLAGNEYYCFLDGYSGYFQISIDPRDQEKTTFTCPYGTFAYRRMPFGLCNAPGTFQRSLKYLFAKKDAKARLLRWVLLLQEFDFKVLNTKGAENLAADHLSRLENPYENVLGPKGINETFPLETL